MKLLNCTQIKKNFFFNRGNICTYKKTKWETKRRNKVKIKNK